VPDQATRTGACLICATPRTGSSLLCGLLDSTGVAGHPESYFRQPDEPAWAARWGIADADGTFSDARYIAAARAAGQTANGVFAARIMWGSLDQVLGRLRALNPGLSGADRDLTSDTALLDRAFGPTRFLYLYRGDVVAQAVSWSRAEQSGLWFETGTKAGPGSPSGGPKPRFDFDHINELVQTIGAHNQAWRAWFAGAGVDPYVVPYERLDADPVAVASGVLDFLGLSLPPGGRIQIRHRRLADDLSAGWITRYRAQARAGLEPG
jgi:LPS sulfotransferase NodH